MKGKRLLVVCLSSMVLAGWSGVAAAGEGSLADLAFMSGCWRGEVSGEGATIEERHSSPAGGMMLGTSQVVAGGRTTFFEFIKIEQSGEGIAMTPAPRGKTSVSFHLVDISPGKAVFENLRHDFPKRIVYQLREDGSLVARVEGDQPEKTQELVMQAIPCAGRRE